MAEGDDGVGHVGVLGIRILHFLVIIRSRDVQDLNAHAE
jgi:hypothetical protein